MFDTETRRELYAPQAVWPRPRRLTLEERAEARAEREREAHIALRDEMRAALLGDPQTPVRAPSLCKHLTPAADVVADLCGWGGEDLWHDALRIIGDAAKGTDVELRAQALVAALADRYADREASDLVREARS